MITMPNASSGDNCRADEAFVRSKNPEEEALYKQATEGADKSHCCLITLGLMYDPVITSDGHTYERKAIELWFKSHDTSPATGEKLPNKTLIPNHAIRGQIIEYLERWKQDHEASSSDASRVCV